MKLAFVQAVAVAGSLALAIADQAPTPASANATVQGRSHSVVLNSNCAKDPPNDGVYKWWYNSKAEGPYWCTTNHDTKDWAMLKAYRSGGTQGVHYKYTDDPNDGECLTNWTYYSSDGQSVIEKNIGRTTFNGDTRRWCALPVYRSGGVLGKQWGYCVDNCGFNT